MAIDSGSGPPTPDTALTADELSRLAAEVFRASPFPALVLEMPAERIVAASPAATVLLDPAGDPVVGKLLEEFTADRAEVGSDRFAGARLNGLEVIRLIRRGGDANLKVRLWARTFADRSPAHFALVILVADLANRAGVHRADWDQAPAVVGTIGTDLLIETISAEAAELFHRPVLELIGESVLALVAEYDLPSCLAMLTAVPDVHESRAMYLDVHTGADATARCCELLVFPLEPAPRCMFVFLPTPGGMSRAQVPLEISATLRRMGRGSEVGHLARDVFGGISERQLPGMNRLTTRELEIVTRLVDGDRAPAIATSLFLSQSTVRNHLASVFAKLGVTSQQQLLDLLRAAQSYGQEYRA